jgi:hypothetical protein
MTDRVFGQYAPRPDLAHGRNLTSVLPIIGISDYRCAERDYRPAPRT